MAVYQPYKECVTMSEKTAILNLIDRVGSNAYDAIDNGDGTADIEMTAAQGTKIIDLLGKDSANVVNLKASHVIVRVNLASLEKAAEDNQKTARGSSVTVNIVSRMTYAIDAPDAANEVKKAWWEAESQAGGIKVNGKEYPIFSGMAADYYEAPKDEEAAKEWNPERVVYVVELPTAEGVLTLTSYGITNLIRRVASRNEAIG
jgi:hypothetical protein